MTNNTNFYTVHSSLWNIINYSRHRSQPLCQLIKIKILWNRVHTQRAQITIDLGSCAVTQLVNIFHASESNIWGFWGDSLHPLHGVTWKTIWLFPYEVPVPGVRKLLWLGDANYNVHWTWSLSRVFLHSVPHGQTLLLSNYFLIPGNYGDRNYERKDKKIKNSIVKYFRKDSISTHIFRKPQ